MAVGRSAPPRPAMYATLGRIFGLVLALSVIGAAPERALAADEDNRAIFAILDENGDGAVTQVEFLRSKTEIFYRALRDVDQDQRLGPEEINVTPEAFDDADLNGDGKLSGAEFVQARFTQFETIDANSDQEITIEEFEEFGQQYQP